MCASGGARLKCVCVFAPAPLDVCRCRYFYGPAMNCSVGMLRAVWLGFDWIVWLVKAL